MSRIRASLACSLALGLLAVVAPAQAAKSAASLEGIPHYDHVAIVVLENEDFSKTFGPTSPAKYLNQTLVPLGTLDTNYYATGHVSLDNYIAMTSAQPANPLTST